MSYNNLPFHQSALEGSLDESDAESVALEQDEKAENAKEKEVRCRTKWKRISSIKLNKTTFPFLSEENEKDPVLLRSLIKILPFKGSRRTEKWQRVADDVNAAKSVSTGQPLFKLEVGARGCKDRFMKYIKFIKKYQGKYSTEGPGEILLAIQNLYEEFKNSVVEGRGGKLKGQKRNIPECPLLEMRARKRIVLDNDVISKDEDSSATYREKARMLREQNIARKLKLKAFELKLKEKALMMKEQEAEDKQKESKEMRDNMRTMFNSFQTFTSTMMSTMMSTTHGTTSTSCLPKLDNTLILSDRKKNGSSCDSDDNDDYHDDDDDDSSTSTPSHYCLP